MLIFEEFSDSTGHVRMWYARLVDYRFRFSETTPRNHSVSVRHCTVDDKTACYTPQRALEMAAGTAVQRGSLIGYHG